MLFSPLKAGAETRKLSSNLSGPPPKRSKAQHGQTKKSKEVCMQITKAQAEEKKKLDSS